MTTPPRPTAELEAIIAEAKSQNVKDWICFCPGPACDTGHPCVSVAALLACAERGIAPPRGEVEWALGYLDSIAIRVHDTEDNREKAFDILRRLSAPPMAAPSGEAAPREASEVAELRAQLREAESARDRARAQAESAFLHNGNIHPSYAATKIAEIHADNHHDARVYAERKLEKAYKKIDEMSRALRTLSTGKAAAEAELERSEHRSLAWHDATIAGRDHLAAAEARAEAWRADWFTLRARLGAAEDSNRTAESRCAALERALRKCLTQLEILTDGPGQVHDERVAIMDARAALSSAEPAKPVGPSKETK